ncbi:hypothetical protein ACPXBI_21255, partial [Escherichia coli]
TITYLSDIGCLEIQGASLVPLNMIRPFETLTLPLPANSAGGQMTWRFINDYGAVSDPIKMTL